MRQRSHDTGQLGVSYNELGGVGPKGFVERNGKEGLGDETNIYTRRVSYHRASNVLDYPQGARNKSILTCNLPLRAVLAPETDAMVTWGDTDATMKLEDTRSEILGARGYFSICGPGILILPALGGRVPASRAQTLAIRVVLGTMFEQIVEGAHLRAEGRKQLVLEFPMTVDGRAAFALGTRNRNCIRRPRWRRPCYLLNIG